jgi:hypothetical protein
MSTPKPTIQQFINLMNQKLQTGSCWSAFNQKHRYYEFLLKHANLGSFYKPSDLPTRPNPSDNNNLNC